MSRIKKWRSDGPPHASKGYEHSWLAFQGKAYPNPYNGSLDDDQLRLDRERERQINKRDELQEREVRRFNKHMAKRRREKSGGR